MTGVAPSGGNISKTTARLLTLRWSAHLSGPIASSPTIVNGRLYVGDWAGNEWSLDAATGAVVAHAFLGTTQAPQCTPAVLGITSAAAVDHGTVFVAGGDNSFYALDAQTLDVRWSQVLGDSAAGYYGWSSPAVLGSRVFQGVSSNCDHPFVAGRLVSLDRSSGEFNADQDFVGGPLGAGVWTSPAVDTATNSVFVTTGSAYDMYIGYAYSIVRMNLDDLRVTDSWKITTIPEWSDSDWGTSPTLFSDGEGNRLLGAGQKDGSYYAFNRDNLGAGPIWSSPIAVMGDCPQCGHGIVSTAAFDGKALYVGSGQASSDATNMGAITALDPRDGHVIWQTRFAAPVIAPISYANGVLFTTTGKSLVALDADTGAVLSTFATNAACFGGVAIDRVLRGRPIEDHRGHPA